MRDYYRDLADRATKTAAQAAVLSIGVESAQVNALAVDWSLLFGMALGGALLSLLTNVAERGLFGRRDEAGASEVLYIAVAALVIAMLAIVGVRVG